VSDSHPGILPSQEIEALIETGAITARDQDDFEHDQVQPASLDLRLGARAWRVRASFLPGLGRTVAERIPQVAMHELDLTRGAVLERGCVYIAELQERLDLPPQISARANPKSSTGRVDVFVRLLTDRGAAFDDVATGYQGPCFIEIAPQTFSVLVRRGTRLNQLRLKRGAPPKLSVRDVGVDLTGKLAGYRGRRHAPVIDLDFEDGHNPKDYWEPLKPYHGQLLLDPGEFYILASKEAVEIPVLEAAEMTPIDPSVGEFRVHYAGFFDPGFGCEETKSKGSKGVLEVRSHETPFLLEDGQTVARLVYEPLTEKRFWRRAGLRLAAIALGLAAALPAAAAPAMWRVSDADSEIYLFGTMHALPPGLDWRTPAYDAAYAKAGAVWFEADVDNLDPAAVGGLVAQYGVDRTRRLTDQLQRVDVNLLKRRLARSPVKLEAMQHLRPWAAALALESMPLGRRGYDIDAGADLVVTRAAKAAEKPVRTFETVEEQVRMFADLPQEAELQYLTDVLQGRSGLGGPQSLERAWIAGDVAALDEGLVTPMRTTRPALYDMLLKRRNAAWAEALTTEMAGAGVSLVNVGALHMLGDDGLPAMMLARGFTVTRVQ
jgi:dCTP deaminase